MRFFASGPDEVGFFAAGQVATGVIALGQLARGVIAIGQGAIGIVAVGQGAVGLLWASGMVGVSGRRGYGIILPLIPAISAPRVPPVTIPLGAVQRGGPGADGWVSAALGQDQLGLGLFDGGARLPVKMERRLLVAGRYLAGRDDVEKGIFAHTRAEAGCLVCDKIVYVPKPSYRQKVFRILAPLQLAGFLALSIGFWPAVGNDLVGSLREGGASSAPAAPSSHGHPSGQQGHQGGKHSH